VTAPTLTPSTPREEALAAALRPIHNGWLQTARRFLEPTLEYGADFWARWAAVRYLSDGFRRQYRMERALVEQLAPLLRIDVGDRLLREGDRVFLLRLELNRVGRRRGTAAAFAACARELLERVGLWCADIELAAHGVAPDALPREGANLLAHLEDALASGHGIAGHSRPGSAASRARSSRR
jgi:hypothetical protein